MTYIDRLAFKPIANAIASRLMTALKNSDIPKIGIDEIRAAIAETVDGQGYTDEQIEVLEDLTTRRVVESVG